MSPFLWLLVLPIVFMLLLRVSSIPTRPLEPIEKIGWVAGTVGVAIAVLAWVIGDISFVYRLVIGLVALAILVVTAIWSKHSAKKSTERAEEGPMVSLKGTIRDKVHDVADETGYKGTLVKDEGGTETDISLVRRLDKNASTSEALRESEKPAAEADAQVHGTGVGETAKRRDAENQAPKRTNSKRSD